MNKIKVYEGFLEGYKEFKSLHQTTAFKKYPCPYYVFFIKNLYGSMDIVFKSKNHKDKQWWYVKYGDYKITYNVREVDNKAYLNLKNVNKRLCVVSKYNTSKYIITEDGVVINRRRSIIIKNSINSYGYHYCNVINDNFIRRFIFIHRLVAHAFCPRPDRHLDKDYNELHVNHIDCNKINNHYTNLEWCTIQENNRHVKNNDLLQIGEECGISVFTNQEVKAIRDEWILTNRKYTVREHSKKYGVAENTMNLILRNISYRDPNYIPDIERISVRSGEEHHRSKLTNQQVKEIRDDYLKNLRPYKYYIDNYNVSIDVIQTLLNNKTYHDPEYVVPEFIGKRKMTFEDASWVRKHKSENPNTKVSFYFEKYGVDKTLIYLILKNKIHYDPSYNI